jgi:hypothetical protein
MRIAPVDLLCHIADRCVRKGAWPAESAKKDIATLWHKTWQTTGPEDLSIGLG